ncbi:SDR family NAD(P)-dependent oxidoreductase [Oricola nitratireducens]|uniref:SDR family NAD(P)-dependent oxidoreductase n=1 Tax=Oricola nitratireducens TaxID=2775868 RepID=UPI00186690F9|nr:SDR family NAD(P)-dependent oxidoreductase [Oricola nitratireducens]
MTIAGKRVLITGGGTGTGADFARGFAEAGAEIVIAGRRREPLEKVAAGNAAIRCVTADVTDEASVKAMFEEAGPVDIVIANAGAAESSALAKTSLDQWNALIAVNLTGTFLTMREGLRQMHGWGRLIAVASVAGLKGAGYISAYSASKHGVVGMIRSVAHEVARQPVTANAICPGYIETEMTERTIANIMQKTGRSREDAIAAVTATNPQRRLIQPAEVTAAALYLCGPGSEGVNGQAIAITGGES